ncbi:C-C motif chemokine 19 [Ornithorhynchus anatinus]|uniref:C-C motif chemokine 19 n=1 Tax=Ornithorhynchus anatinus TaxID=9258 RepID=UPI0010A81DC9|nr:C-C motif chemokine 19 [Ornithorhynchus anatinus]
MRCQRLSFFFLLLLLLCTAPWALGGTNDAVDCCLSVTPHPVPRHIVRAYRRLGPHDGCTLSATVFTTVKGQQLCAPVNVPWVRGLIRRLERLCSQWNKVYCN